MNNDEFVKHQSEMARGVVEIKDDATRDAFEELRRDCRLRLKAVEAKHSKIIKDAGLALAQAYADEAADSNDLNKLSGTLEVMCIKYNVESENKPKPTKSKKTPKPKTEDK